MTDETSKDQRIAELEAEVDQLTRWKGEATEVILGLQDLGNALGLRLGERITGGTATAAAKKLKSERDEATATLANVAALAAKHNYCPCPTPGWLRAALDRAAPPAVRP